MVLLRATKFINLLILIIGVGCDILPTDLEAFPDQYEEYDRDIHLDMEPFDSEEGDELEEDLQRATLLSSKLKNRLRKRMGLTCNDNSNCDDVDYDDAESIGKDIQDVLKGSDVFLFPARMQSYELDNFSQ
ncbi:MAG: hypothetical protein MHMPM18_002445, partial [Marteilia pararefringens]